MTERIIFHIDVNSAFLSWTSVRRAAQGESDLRTVPAVICGDPDKRTSVVLAKSQAAKAYGIKTGEPVSMALRKCPSLQTAPPDFKLYSKYSADFMEICARYTPCLEKFSIDECFLDMTGMKNVYPDIIAAAHEIKDRIKNELGFTVNVGIGSNKLLAKTASDFEKPDKVHTLFANEIEQKMWPLPVSDLLFLGRATASKLNAIGIKTIGQLAAADTGTLKALVGNKAGEQLHNYANGIDDSPVRDTPREVKSYGHSITVEENVTDLKTAQSLLLSLTDAAASRMRAGGKKAYNISVNIRDSAFKNRSHRRELNSPTDVTLDIYEVVKQLFSELWRGEPLRLLGVSLSDLTDGDGEQISLFGSANPAGSEKLKKVDAAVDAIRNKYGDSKILLGSTMGTKRPKKK